MSAPKNGTDASAAAAAPSHMPSHILSNGTIACFALPVMASGYMFCIVSLYAMKFATDVLLIAPAVMGLLFGISRLWDAVSDPLVGYWSDGTRSRLGRRRPWILAAMLPVVLSFWMLFSPPTSLSTGQLAVWMGVAIVGFYTAQTLMVIPHMSLGAELSQEPHNRNKIFGARHAGWISGYIVALVTLYLLLNAEGESAAAVRALASEQTFYIGVIALLCFGLCVWAVRERSDYAGRGGHNPLRALRDLWRNGPARLILIVHFVQEVAMSSITILTVYVAEYVAHVPRAAPLFILCYLVFSVAPTPLWIALARRWGKKRLWIASLLFSGVAFGGMYFVGPGDIILLLVLAALAGLVGGCGYVVGPAALSDVIDLDEYRTGERKEGAYAAGWYFVQKSAYGIMLVITGFALSWAGFVPKVEQTEEVIFVLRFLYALLPLICFLLAAVMFVRYTLDEAAHTEIVRALKAKPA